MELLPGVVIALALIGLLIIVIVIGLTRRFWAEEKPPRDWDT
jgi:hypothetical protein